jgi:hypothetical protein
MHIKAMYEHPREATERIVCANFHLAQKAQKAADIEAPQAV